MMASSVQTDEKEAFSIISSASECVSAQILLPDPFQSHTEARTGLAALLALRRTLLWDFANAGINQ